MVTENTPQKPPTLIAKEMSAIIATLTDSDKGIETIRQGGILKRLTGSTNQVIATVLQIHNDAMSKFTTLLQASIALGVYNFVAIQEIKSFISKEELPEGSEKYVSMATEFLDGILFIHQKNQENDSKQKAINDEVKQVLDQLSQENQENSSKQRTINKELEDKLSQLSQENQENGSKQRAINDEVKQVLNQLSQENQENSSKQRTINKELEDTLSQLSRKTQENTDRQEEKIENLKTKIAQFDREDNKHELLTNSFNDLKDDSEQQLQNFKTQLTNDFGKIKNYGIIGFVVITILTTICITLTIIG